jgi:hypothetical protein
MRRCLPATAVVALAFGLAVGSVGLVHGTQTAERAAAHAYTR